MEDPKFTEDFIKNQGNQAYYKRDYPSAIKWYSLGIKKFPSSSLFYLNRSMVLLSQHKYLASIEDSSKAQVLDSENPKVYYRKAVALKALGNYSEALETLSLFFNKNLQNDEIFSLKLDLESKLASFQCIPKDRQKFSELFDWLTEGGAVFPKIYLEYYSHDYRGVHCSRKIDKGECVLLVPLSHIITLEMAKLAPVGRKMIEHDLDLLSPKHCFLTTFILQEQRKEKSFWRPYLNILPQSFSNFPVFYNDEELEMLAGSPFLDLVNEKKADIAEDYENICRADSSFRQFSLEEFTKTRMAVSSRIFSIEVQGKVTDAFVPLADMLNHRRPRQTNWTYDDSKGGFIVEAVEDIEKGEQVMDSYGQKCNSRFLLNYGFIVDHNDANEFPFVVKLKNDYPYFNLKSTHARERVKVFKMKAEVAHQSFLELLAFIRFFVEDSIEVLNSFISQFTIYDCEVPIQSFPPTSAETEKKVIQWLIDYTRTAINKYPNTLEQDLQTLPSLQHENEKNCLKMIICEKQVLNYFDLILPQFLVYLDHEVDINSPEIPVDHKYFIKNIVIPLKN
jgi:histone-lysine N-methyltransferase SETD3